MLVLSGGEQFAHDADTAALPGVAPSCPADRCGETTVGAWEDAMHSGQFAVGGVETEIGEMRLAI